jgi:polyferredoxin
MDKMGYEKGLIRYSTQNAIDGKPTRVARPRILVYGALLLVLVAGFAWGIAARSPLIADVLRDRNALYRETATGIDNGYTLKLVNKTDRAQAYTVRIETPVAGLRLRGGPRLPVRADAQQVLSLPLEVSAPGTLRGRQPLRFVIEADDGSASETVDSNFFGPM